MDTPVDQVLTSRSLFLQRMYVRAAIGAAREQLPPNLAAVVVSELESVINLSSTFGASPLAIKAAGELLRNEVSK